MLKIVVSSLFIVSFASCSAPFLPPVKVQDTQKSLSYTKEVKPKFWEYFEWFQKRFDAQEGIEAW